METSLTSGENQEVENVCDQTLHGRRACCWVPEQVKNDTIKLMTALGKFEVER